MRIVALLILAAVAISPVAAETLYLDAEGSWTPLGENEQDQYLQRVARIKQLVSDGEAGAAQSELEALRWDYPTLQDQGLDAFMAAEAFYERGRLIRAARAYTEYLDAYPTADLYDAAMERLFQIGQAFLRGQRKTVLRVFRMRAYDDGARIMEALADRAGDAPVAQRALIAVARSKERRELWQDAHLAWSNVHSRWPGGEIGRQSLEGMARSMYYAYNGPHFESASLVSARSYYLQLMQRFPEYAGGIGAAEIIGQIEEEIARKELAVAHYYRRTRSHEAAMYYFQRITENWPGTGAAAEAEVLLAEYAE